MAHLSKLTLTAFRNYDHLRLTAGPQPIVLTGPNGAGKTNLLEAISLLGPGRGLRNARLSEMAQAGQKAPWAVAATLATELGAQDVGTGPEDNADRRIVRIDGVNRTQGALVELASILWLTPAMDRLFAEPAAARRKFIDRIVYGYDHEHVPRVARYEQALRERQKLLEENGDPAWIDGVEMVIAETGTAIAAARLRIVTRLDKACATEADTAFPAPSLAMIGDIETWLGEGSALAAEDRYRAALSANRGLDRSSGRVTVGAHRSDLVAHYRDKAMPAQLCSTGEQKALLIALMLANAQLMIAEQGAKPILILDEITAHLDEARRAALCRRLVDMELQAWLSGTDKEDFAPLGNGAARLVIHNGSIET